MKKARRWLAALLSAVLILGALPMAALAEEDGTAAVGNLDEFKAALEDAAVRRIEITGNVVIPEEESLDAGEKEIHVSRTGNLLLDPGAVMTSDAPMGKFSFEEEDGVSQWDRIAYGMAAFLMDDSGHRVLLGSLPEDVGSAIDGMRLAVLSGDVTVEGRLEVGMLLVMNDGVLTLDKGCVLTVSGYVYAKVINDFGELWGENIDCEEYNRPRLLAYWGDEVPGGPDEYDRRIRITPYDEAEVRFVSCRYEDGSWTLTPVEPEELQTEAPLRYGTAEGHDDRPVLTAKDAEWNRVYKITERSTGNFLQVEIALPELGCYGASAASTGDYLTSLKYSPLSSGEFYVCINPEAWFVEEGWTVSDLTVKGVRYDENGPEELTNPPVASAKVREGVWKITVNGCDFNAEFTAEVSNPESGDSFELGTGLYIEPAEILTYSDAFLEGERNDWGILWKDAYKSTLQSTLSLKAGNSKNLTLYLLVYQGQAEDGKPAGWYCEDVNIHQIRAEGVTVAQGKEDDDRVIRVTAGSAGSYKVIRMQEEQSGEEWVCVPGSTRGEPLNVTVTSSGSSGGSGSNGGSGSGGGTSGSGSSAGNLTYAVSVPSGITGGTVSVQPQSAKRGDTVTVTVRPENGYALRSLTVTTAAGRKVDTTDAGDGRYTFVMPGSQVTVKASFTKVQEEAQPTAESFVDVPSGAYYAEAVRWAVENGVTGCIGGGRFGPDAPCTRAQTVTFLWRAAGSPAPSSRENPFVDVDPGAYYYDAVLWAVEKGITGGTTAKTFGPENIVTRGQTASFLHRAAGSPAANGGSFSDVPSGAYYAGAVQWAAEKGITGGTGDGRFNPGAPCTRAHIVTFLFRSQKS